MNLSDCELGIRSFWFGGLFGHCIDLEVLPGRFATGDWISYPMHKRVVSKIKWTDLHTTKAHRPGMKGKD